MSQLIPATRSLLCLEKYVAKFPNPKTLLANIFPRLIGNRSQPLIPPAELIIIYETKVALIQENY